MPSPLQDHRSAWTRLRSLSTVAWRSGLAAAAMLGAAALGNAWAARRAERRGDGGKFLAVDGVRVRYLEGGAGTPIVLIHGNGVSSDDFRQSGLFDALAARHRVIALDRPGFGHTPRPTQRRWDAAAQADLMLKALQALGVEDPVVVGHSWGALVALNMALQDPARVRGLVLMSGYYRPTLRLDVPFAAGPAIPVLGALLRYTVSPLMGRLLAPTMFRLLFSPAEVTPRFKAEFSVEMAVRPSQIRASASDGAMMVGEAKKLQARRDELTLPILLIAGRGDRIASFEDQAAAFARQLGNAELVAVENAGHMVHHVAPEAVAQAIEGFSRRREPLRRAAAARPAAQLR